MVALPKSYRIATPAAAIHCLRELPPRLPALGHKITRAAPRSISGWPTRTTGLTRKFARAISPARKHAICAGRTAPCGKRNALWLRNTAAISRGPSSVP